MKYSRKQKYNAFEWLRVEALKGNVFAQIILVDFMKFAESEISRLSKKN